MTKLTLSSVAVCACALLAVAAGREVREVRTPLGKALSHDQGRGRGHHQGEGLTFETRLEGANEVPPVETDTFGKAEFKFDEDLLEARFEVKVQAGVAITQSHIHCAPEDVNGPVMAFLFGLVPGGFNVDGNLAAFTLTDANIAAVGANCVPTIGMPINNLVDLVQAMRDGNIYVNVHSVAHPGGQIRGQLRLDDNDDDGDDDDDDNDNDNDDTNDDNDNDD